jgi:GT2 family glycosyltransferase
MVTASIVLYKNSKSDIEKILDSFVRNTIHNENMRIYFIDNSPTDILRCLFNKEKFIYIFNPSNPGFGAAHNIAIKRAIDEKAIYHFVINPDIYFDEGVIFNLLDHIRKDATIGMIMPQILNLDGSIQFLPKLLPSPFSILIRKLKFSKTIYGRFINRYEMRNIPKNMVYNAPILSGCFTLLNLNAVQNVGMFDDKYFMYFEDWDLSRRMHHKYKTIYYPLVSVYHGYDSGANKSFKLFRFFLCSAFTYFNKWGWFCDRDRKKINKAALAQFNL